MSEPISRRNFLKKGLLIGAASGVVLCGGTSLVATYRPPLEKPTFSTESNGLNRILIAYATKAGTAAGIATHIGEQYANQGLAVDVMPVEQVNDLSAYATVIVGSGIYIGKIIPKAMDFIEKNQSALQNKSFHIFIACMTLREDTDENRKIVSDYLIPARAVVKPQSEGLFAGTINLSHLNLLEKMVVSSMQVPEGDYRNWPQIEAWAQAIPTAI
ncbi:hypothetical protein ADN00_06315 [Ornatilinea apprima]|uniref:Flavodoxin-like domain-containing protein n=1 Tax=Ornatilinea apprima TaxID=1134406 RepID=A0A0P6X6Z3_9CHLR|nr:flavodoxin domain-containing protein [Ornatilinea apprima]KPL78829.1 hypothetical protein ADN00_06315 [Ornatilinea apprima]